MEELEVVDLSVLSKSQNTSVSLSYESIGMKGPIDCYYPLKPGNDVEKSGNSF